MDDSTGDFDATGDFDVTGSQPVRKTKEIVNDATEAFVPAGAQPSQAPSGNTNEHEATSVSTFIPEHSAKERHESMPSSSTMVISRLETADDNDDTNEESIPASHMISLRRGGGRYPVLSNRREYRCPDGRLPRDWLPEGWEAVDYGA